MAFVLKADQSARKRLIRTLKKQLDGALEELRSHKAREDVVHDARRCLKRARAVARLARSSMGRRDFARINTNLRDAGRPLSEVRDADVLAGTLDRLLERFAGVIDRRRLGPVRHGLLEHRRQVHERVLKKADALGRAVKMVRRTRSAVTASVVKRRGWAMLGPGLCLVFSEGRKAVADAARKPSTTSLHQLRKQAKYLRYEVELLSPLWPDVLTTLAGELHRLTDLLGEHHDLAMLRHHLIEGRAPHASDVDRDLVVALLDRRRDEVEQAAVALASRIYAEKPRAFERRLHRVWSLWRQQGRRSCDADAKPSRATRTVSPA